MVGLTYTMDAARSVTAGAIDGGEKPSVPSAMLKYHVTEMGRIVANDAMDVHGGKGICLGPNNYLGRGYQIVPVAITVEGANILTRNLIIFGQGAIRCHPFVLRGDERGAQPRPRAGVDEFDRALFGHIGFTTLQRRALAGHGAHAARASRGAPVRGRRARYYQHIERFSASFAFAADVAMLALGGYLKKKETCPRAWAMCSRPCTWPRWCSSTTTTRASRAEDLPVVEWACRELLYQAQEQLHSFLRNFPNRCLAGG